MAATFRMSINRNGLNTISLIHVHQIELCLLLVSDISISRTEKNTVYFFKAGENISNLVRLNLN